MKRIATPFFVTGKSICDGVRLTMIAVLTIIVPQLHSAEKPRQSAKEKLVTWATMEAPQRFDGPASPDGKPAKKWLPETPSGLRRWDVSPFFEARGVVMGPGAEAIFLETGDLVVTNTQEQIDLMDRVLLGGGWCCGGSVNVIDVEASLWDYDVPEGELPPRPNRLVELREAAGDSLRRIGSVSVMTKSGNRTVASVKPLPPGTTSFSKQTCETTFTVEPVIGPDSKTVDMQIELHARLPRAGGAEDFEVAQTTNISVTSGENIIVHVSAIPSDAGGKQKQVALAISARVVNPDGRPREQIEAETKRETARITEAIVRRVRAGLPIRK